MTTSRTSTPTSTATSAQAVAPSQFWVRVLVSAAAAASLNVVLLAIGRAAGASLTMEVPDPIVVEWPSVVVFSTLPLLLGGLVAWLVARRVPRARRWFAWVGLVLAVLSCAVLISAPDAATAMTLGAMHLVVGAAWFVALTARTGRR